MSAEPVRVGPAWLALREPADAAARATDLVERVRPHLPTGGPVVIHDLGCGTGSMGRWLAPQLAGPQHWIMYDWDADLLAYAAAGMPAHAADDAAITIEIRRRDITRLDPADLAGASLITASALLDMFTAEELARFVTAAAGAGCPVLVTISVTGRVDLVPADPLDGPIADAFNAHQRRTAGERHLLGPDAVGVAADAFHRLGHDVLLRPSPWHLGGDQAALTAEWFTGWIGAAGEQVPDLASRTAEYAQRRRSEAENGRLTVTVHHQDLLALQPEPSMQ